ncbi:MAG: Hsp20 family protein [Eubacteriales bacterium]|nr:Hsp20 family protein [Eubacteriales bacterium]MDD4327413.1 Hsp20 family protein [Eubacteriales bacterium]MDD4717705.1 Hsp20 family protein [Eubacteriales bacterium]NCU26127.1 Hsp20 family protein [Candidatus Nomurabacteria bacterium]
MASLVPFNRNRGSLKTTGFDDFYNMLDNFFEDSYSPLRSLSRDTFKLDVQDNETEYLIEAELPGVNKDEINIEINENRLTIGLERKEEVNEEKKNYIHRERRCTSMQRCVFLKDAKADDVEAKLDNGILSLKIPKDKEKVQVRKIEIK